MVKLNTISRNYHVSIKVRYLCQVFGRSFSVASKGTFVYIYNLLNLHTFTLWKLFFAKNFPPPDKRKPCTTRMELIVLAVHCTADEYFLLSWDKELLLNMKGWTYECDRGRTKIIFIIQRRKRRGSVTLYPFSPTLVNTKIDPFLV